MRQAVRRWLVGAVAVAAAMGAAVLGQAGTAGAATVAATGRAAPAHATAARRAVSQTTGGYVPTGHVIRYGSRGPAVRKLQRRLNQLHYYSGKPDGQFGQNTLEAVWAFKEVQHLGTSHDPNDVSVAFQRRLVHPWQPRKLRPHGGR